MRLRLRSRTLLAATVAVLALAGCGALPQHKTFDDLGERGATLTQADSLMATYSRKRAGAEADLDAEALGDLEAGSLLRVDQSAFRIRRQFGIEPSTYRIGSDVTVWAPRFDSYPVWFAVLSSLPDEGQQVAGVFTRASTTKPWLVATAPRLAEGTVVPRLAIADDGTVPRLVDGPHPTWSDGAPLEQTSSPQRIADDYADVLTSKKSSHADEFVEDSFLTQMRKIRAAQPHRNVTFDQTWRAGKVRYVLRLADGGSLMFVTLERTDRFDVDKGSALQFDGSEAAAYLSGPIRRRARLHYEHEVLMVVPGKGKPLVIGQYGGLVDARGH